LDKINPMLEDPTTRTYNRIASAYAARDPFPLEAELDQFTSMLDPGSLVLDVGSGPGQYSQALRARGLRVIDFDLSAGMLQVARQHYPDQISGRQILGDMRRLAIRARVMDGCFVCASLLHLKRSDAPVALGEFKRVLKSGGALYVAVKHGRGESWENGTWDSPRFFTYYRQEEMLSLVDQHGFKITRRWINQPSRPGDSSWINLFARSR
jgi:ubiquinone/menaquinone biosynthesis C-methylase UbiE